MRTYFYLLLLFTFTGSFGFVYSQCSVSDYHLTSVEDLNGDYQFYFGLNAGPGGERVIMKSGTLHLYWSTGQHQSYSYNSLDVSTFPVGGMGLLVTPLNLPSEGCGFVEAVFEFSISGCTTPSFTLSETIFYGTPVTGSITASAGSCGSYTFSANLTSLGITSPLWGFGDGVHSTHPSPFYTYSSNGTYIVTLQDAEDPTVCPSYIEVTVSGFPSASY
ncbi:MAG: PKD domain-containing protein, partial [Crocinitomicaceae bacterium]|nr:PKD domain-containing protein [Crocinitomicaceae bacterium]